MPDPSDNQTGRYSAQWWSNLSREMEYHRSSEEQSWGGIDENLTALYISGECSEDERLMVEQAMQEYPAVREAVAIGRELAGKADQTSEDLLLHVWEFVKLEDQSLMLKNIKLVPKYTSSQQKEIRTSITYDALRAGYKEKYSEPKVDFREQVLRIQELTDLLKVRDAEIADLRKQLAESQSKSALDTHG